MTERYSAKEVCVGNCVVVQRILSHPKYTGCVVFNQKSGKLRSRTKRNPRREWIIISGCFEPLIGKEQFDRAQERLRKRAFLKSDEELLTELSVYVEKHGKATQEMLRTDGQMATDFVYARRFGSLSRALDRERQAPAAGFSAIDLRARLKRELHDEFVAILLAGNISWRRFQSVFSIPDRPPVLVEVARCFKLKNGQLRWEIRYSLPSRAANLTCIALRLAPDNRSRIDYLSLKALPEACQRLQFSDERISKIAVVSDNLADITQTMFFSKYTES